MAIALIGVTNSSVTTGVSSLTISVTVTSGSNRVLVVGINQCSTVALATISSVVFNGSETMTLAKAQTFSPTFFHRSAMYYLVNPTVTTANVVVTFSNANDNLYQAASVIRFEGIDQASPIDATSGNTGTSGTCSTVITTVANDAWVLDCAQARDGLTIGANQTQRVSLSNGSIFTKMSTVNGKATPGTETMDWTLASAQWLISAISLKPAVTGHPLSINTGSYGLSGVDALFRIGSTTYLRYRK